MEHVLIKNKKIKTERGCQNKKSLSHKGTMHGVLDHINSNSHAVPGRKDGTVLHL